MFLIRFFFFIVFGIFKLTFLAVVLFLGVIVSRQSIDHLARRDLGVRAGEIAEASKRELGEKSVLALRYLERRIEESIGDVPG